MAINSTVKEAQKEFSRFDLKLQHTKQNKAKNACFSPHLKINYCNPSKLASVRKSHAINFSDGATAFKITSNVILT